MSSILLKYWGESAVEITVATHLITDEFGSLRKTAFMKTKEWAWEFVKKHQLVLYRAYLHAINCLSFFKHFTLVLVTCVNIHKHQCQFLALILREQGDIQKSLELFQKTTQLNPENVNNLKQVARSL